MATIEEKLEAMRVHGIVVIIVRPQEHQKMVCFILRKMTLAKDKPCLYVTLSRPYEELEKMLGENQIDPEGIHFIDCFRRGAKKPAGTERLTFLDQPQSLTELSIAISKKMDGGRYTAVIFDSIGALAAYNDLETVERFVRFLANKMRMIEMWAFIVSDDETGKRLASTLEQFADAVVKSD